MIGRPGAAEHAAYYGRYVDRVEGDDLLAALRTPVLSALLHSIAPALATHAYAPGKWTVSQVARHALDTERIFAARALRIARGDATPLPGYDEDTYAAATPLDGDLAALAGQFDRLRATTVDLFADLPEAGLTRMGTASGHPLSARAAGWIVAGHDRHHAAIVQGRYLG